MSMCGCICTYSWAPSTPWNKMNVDDFFCPKGKCKHDICRKVDTNGDHHSRLSKPHAEKQTVHAFSNVGSLARNVCAYMCVRAHIHTWSLRLMKVETESWRGERDWIRMLGRRERNGIRVPWEPKWGLHVGRKMATESGTAGVSEEVERGMNKNRIQWHVCMRSAK